jgi:hypothetical protein
MSSTKPLCGSTQFVPGLGVHIGFGRSLKICSVLFLGLILLLMPTRSAFGQATEGTILGTVRDEAGAVLPKTMIKVTNIGTNISRTVLTDEAGNYRVPNLLIGSYRVEGELAGFKRGVVQSVQLSISENVRVDLTLQVGEVTLEVTILDTSERIRTDSAELAYRVPERQLRELPLNGRMYLSLAQLIPGATAGLKDRRRDTYGATITVGGARAEANNYLIDGISNNEERTGGFIVAPSVEAIQEFKVQTSQFSAEYGRAGGAVINVSIKSGTNDFHGALFEFHRNAALDARNFFDPKVLPFIRNQFGGAVGGPVWKDHTFFFFNYEGTRIRQSITRFGNVPEPEWVNGDFSRAPFIIHDPLTARPDPANPSRIIRTPFPGNIIPPGRIDPIGQKIAASYARPNFSQTGSAFNFQSTNSVPNNRNQYNIRIDHRINQADQLFGRFSRFNIEQLDQGLGAFPLSDGTRFTNKGLQIALSETHIFGPNFLNELRAGYSYLSTLSLHADQGGTLGEELGISGLNPTPFESGFPNVSVRNLSGTDHPIGFGLGLPTEEKNEIFQVIETVSLNVGKHGLKFGADIQRVHFNVVTGGVGGLSLGFDGRYTSAVGGQMANVGLADLLLGLPNSMGISRTFDLGRFRFWNTHFFIQDDWQISPNLTLNLGLRYELQTPAKEIRGRESNVDIRTGQVRIQSRAIPWLENVIGVKVTDLPFPIRIEDTDHFYNADKNNFAPRVGLAYRPFGSNRTAIRLGFGTFFVSGLSNITTNGALNAPFLFNQNRVGNPIDPNLNLSSGLPTTFIDALRLPSFQNLQTEDWKVGYYNKWSGGIQHQLTPKIIVETSYLGHTAPNLYTVVRENRPAPGMGPVQARRPYPLLSQFSQFVPINTSTYHGWLNQVRVGDGKSLMLQANYTFSKTLDNQSAFGGAGDGKAGLSALGNIPNLGIQAEKGRASFDARHRFTMTLLYPTPKLQNRNALVRHLLGEWQLSGLLTFQSGFPFTVLLADDRANIGDTAGLRPDRLADGNLPTDQRTPQRWFDTSAFAVPAQFTFGNAGRNIIEQDGIRNIDFGLMKNIPLRMIGETHALQIRAEFFNVFNFVNFDRPLSTIARAGFGQVTATSTDARQIQFGLKYVF